MLEGYLVLLFLLITELFAFEENLSLFQDYWQQIKILHVIGFIIKAGSNICVKFPDQK